MLKKLIYKLLARRHFWRDASFDELSELYISMMFRSLALSLIGIFVPVFLLKSGYSFQSVIGFFVMFFVVKTITDFVAGHAVARFGPKHTMLMSYMFQIVSALQFLTLNTYDWPLAFLAIFWATANSFFFVAFHVDFSKVKHSDHAGKELGYINIMEKIGGIIGPLVSGIVSVIFGPQYIFLFASVLLVMGVIPLFRTAEPTRTHQKIDFQALDVRPLKRDLISYVALNMENSVSVALWPIFLTLFVVTGQVFLTFGIISSLSVCAAALVAYSVGKVVDDKRGGLLLRIAAVFNAGLYAVKPFVTNVVSAGLVGALNDGASVGYRIPYHKGMYDAADRLPGQRIAYIVSMEAVASVGKALVWSQLLLMSFVFNARTVVHIGFFIAALASLCIMTHRFRALE